MISPSAAARTGVPCAAGMSIASCTRPSERASVKVSMSWSFVTPATGMMRCRVPTNPDCGVGEGLVSAGDGEVATLGDGVGDSIETGTSGEAAGELCGDSIRLTIARFTFLHRLTNQTVAMQAPRKITRTMKVRHRGDFNMSSNHEYFSTPRGISGLGCVPSKNQLAPTRSR